MANKAYGTEITIRVSPQQLEDLREVKKLVQELKALEQAIIDRGEDPNYDDEYLYLERRITNWKFESDADVDTMYGLILDALPE